MTLDQLVDDHKKNMNSGIISYTNYFIEIENSLWIKLAPENAKYESNEASGHYGYWQFKFWSKGVCISTDVENKNILDFVANIKARPSIFEKLFGKFGKFK